MLKKLTVIAIATVGFTTSSMASQFMDATWAKHMCSAWNKSHTLKTGLAHWSTNDAKRGYKLIQLYRSHCGVKTKVQLTIVSKGGKAHCHAGGKPDGKKMNYSVDYLMNATDENWKCMGKASFGCGAMGAMMSGKLKFKGPKVEAMKVMSPFGAFLKLVGSVGKNESKTCPR